MQRFLPTQPRTGGCCRGVAAILIASIASVGLAQPPKPTEYDVKAAYLINFGKFVRHSNPQPPHASFDICIVGRDPIGRTIDDLAANEAIARSPVHVRRLGDVSEARTCAIVYISPSESDNVREDLAILAGSDVLTVSDTPDFLERGGMIQFLLIANHVRFAVNLNAVTRAHLVLSSELLRVASSVSGKPQTGEMP